MPARWTRATECTSRRSQGKYEGCYNFEVRNLEIAFIFNQIADLLEIQGANPFRVRAYRRAATNIEGLADNIEKLALGGTLRNNPGIVADIADTNEEYVRNGNIHIHQQLKQQT